jgi:hypothetical protein
MSEALCTGRRVVSRCGWRTGLRLSLPGHEDDTFILPVTVYNRWPGAFRGRHL